MKLTRRRVLIAVSTFIVATALSLFCVVIFGGDRITQANVDRIREGMTLEQVFQILGPPTDSANYNDAPNGHTAYVWEGSDGFAVIIINDQVVSGSRFASYKMDWWSRIKRVFGR